MKKCNIIPAMLLLLFSPVFAQVGIGTKTPHESSILEVKSKNKGLLLPRVSSSGIVNDPQAGLIVWDIDKKCISAYDGTKWSCLSASSSSTPPVNNPTNPTIPPNNNGLLQIESYYPSYAVYARNYQLNDIPAGAVDNVILSFLAIGDASERIVALPGRNFPQDQVYYDDHGAWENNERWMHDINGKSRSLIPSVTKKISVAIGGWPRAGDMKDPLRTGGFSRVASDDVKLNTFTNSLNSWLRARPHITGISLDWEYPEASEKEIYTKFVKAVRKAVGNDITIEVAIWADPSKITERYELDKLINTIDVIHLMAFDYNGAFNSGFTGHGSPIFPSKDPTGKSKADFNVESSLNALEATGFPLDRVSIAIPLYGRSWKNVDFGSATSANNVTSIYHSAAKEGVDGIGTWYEVKPNNPKGIVEYQDLVTNFVNKRGYIEKWDDVAKASYLVNVNEKTLITYDSKRAIEEKIKYAACRNLYGVMVWDLSGAGSGKGKQLSDNKKTTRTDIHEYIRQKVNTYKRGTTCPTRPSPPITHTIPTPTQNNINDPYEIADSTTHVFDDLFSNLIFSQRG